MYPYSPYGVRRRKEGGASQKTDLLLFCAEEEDTDLGSGGQEGTEASIGGGPPSLSGR